MNTLVLETLSPEVLVCIFASEVSKVHARAEEIAESPDGDYREEFRY